MALIIDAPEADRLARDLASMTGESIPVAVVNALSERLERQTRSTDEVEDKERLVSDLMAIAHHCASLPVLDDRSADEIMGWDENGLPT
jgi:antitoxin VapB